mmetsp:Transcript_25950/g.46796  ORF Transcript_25950/g.46796 Transcript_25950/m.46796 type:complete len:309 (-) Transcript_25950:75-1001(-)
MLHHHDVSSIPQLGMLQHLANHVRGRQSLLDIEIRRWLIKHVNIRRLHRHGRNGKSLQFPTTQHANITIEYMGQFCLLGGPRVTIPSFLLGTFILLFQNIADQSAHGPGNVIDVLRLNCGLDIILQYFGEVILQIATTEMHQNFLPVRWRVEAPQIGLHFARQNFEGGGFSDTVRADQAEHLTRPRHGKTMELEAVGSISMRGVLLQIFGQVDDVDGLEWTFLDADSAADAERLAEVGDLGFGTDLDTEFAQLDDGAGFLTFLATFFGFASFGVDDGNSREVGAGVGLFGWLFFWWHFDDRCHAKTAE